jgi:hypothetical protein
MKNDWNSQIRVKNPLDVAPAHAVGSSVFCFKIKLNELERHFIDPHRNHFG